MRTKCLLGATKNNEIVFGEFEITNRNGYAEFTASFDTVRPFREDDYDLEEYFGNVYYDYDKGYLYDLCERFDCRPSELANELANECDDIRDAIDCSLYPECYSIDGTDWYFESCGCGQHDTREEMEEYVNNNAYNLLHELWYKYHLKKVEEDVVAKVEGLIAMVSNVNEEDWITDYIERHEEDL